MSVIVAVKKDGVVYMGADTQTTLGNERRNELTESGYKIRKLANGILLGSTGYALNCDRLYYAKDVFTLPPDGVLTKKHIVKEILPKIYKFLEENKLLKEDDDEVKSGCTLMLVHGDKIFTVSQNFSVVENARYDVIGAGSPYGFPFLDGFDYNGDVNGQLLKALQCCTKFNNSISGPYVFIDSKNLTYTVKEG